MRKFLIADDHSIVRKGIIQLLKDEFGNAIYEEASDGFELLKKAREKKFDVIISDISMPGNNSLEKIKQLHTEMPGTPILILSIYPEEQYAIRLLKAGVSGYLSKECIPDDIIAAVKQLLGGKKYISQELAEQLASNLSSQNIDEPYRSLSDREFAVFKLIAEGKTVSEIASLLSLSVTTISTYRARILSKLNLKNNAEIAKYALDNKLI